MTWTNLFSQILDLLEVRTGFFSAQRLPRKKKMELVEETIVFFYTKKVFENF